MSNLLKMQAREAEGFEPSLVDLGPWAMNKILSGRTSEDDFKAGLQ